MNSIVSSLCILSLILESALPLSALADGPGFDARIKNALQAKAVLASCAKSINDRRGLIQQLESGLVSGVSSAPETCQTNPMIGTQFQKFLKDFKKVAPSTASLKTNVSSASEVKLASELRMQSLRNSLMTYLDAEVRYDLDAPKPQTYFKSATAVKLFCSDSKGHDTCTEGERAELGKIVADYRTSFNRLGLKPSKPSEVKKDLNTWFDALNQAYAPVAAANQRANQVSFGPTFDPNHPNQYATRDETANIVRPYENRVKAQIVKNEVIPELKKYKETERRFLEDSEQGFGVLLYTKAMRSVLDKQAPGSKKIPSDATIRSAVREVRSESLNLAHDVNSELVSTIANQSAGKKFLGSAGTAAAYLLSPVTTLIFGNPFDLKKSIKKMLKTNPVAAGQVLTAHPELATEVCAIAKEIASDDAIDHYTQKGLQVVTWGGMIVGGVMIATGVFSPAGALVETASVAGAEAIALEATATAGLGATSSAIATLGVVNQALGYSALIGNSLYLVKHHQDLKEGIASNQRGLITGNGGSLAELKSLEYQKSREGIEVAETAAMILVPLGLSKAGSLFRNVKLLEGTRAAALFEEMSAVGSRLKPKELAMLKSVELACAAMDQKTCAVLAGMLHSKPLPEQRKILSSTENLEKFMREQVATHPEVEGAVLTRKGLKLKTDGTIEGVTDANRASTAETLLGRKLNETQTKMLTEAHEVGAGESGKVAGTLAKKGNYTPAQLKEKTRVLRAAGFTDAEASRLIRKGIAGYENFPWTPNTSGSSEAVTQFRKAFEKGTFEGDSQYISFMRGNERIPGKIVGLDPRGTGVEVVDAYGGRHHLDFADLQSVRSSSVSREHFGSPMLEDQTFVGKPVSVGRSNGTYTNGKVIGLKADGRVEVLVTDANGTRGTKVLPRSSVFDPIPVKSGALGIDQAVSISSTDGGILNGKVVAIGHDGTAIVEVTKSGRVIHEKVPVGRIMEPLPGGSMERKNWAMRIDERPSEPASRNWASRKVDNYVSRGGQTVEVNLNSPALSEAVDQSMAIIKRVTGIEPGSANMNDPAVRRKIYQAWIEHVVPSFESGAKGSLSSYSSARDRILENGGGTADLGLMLQSQAAVCRELSLAGSVVFGEYGISSKVVTGNISSSRGSGGHAWIIDDQGMVVDNNFTRSVYESFGSYQSETNASILKTTTVVEPK